MRRRDTTAYSGYQYNYWLLVRKTTGGRWISFTKGHEYGMPVFAVTSSCIRLLIWKYQSQSLWILYNNSTPGTVYDYR